MNRRTFNRIVLTSITGAFVAPNLGFAASANKHRIKLGGPVLENYESPEQWIKALNKRAYLAAYCPVSPGTDSLTIKAYKTAAAQSNIIISEVGAWSNPIDPDDSKAREAIDKCIHSLELAEEIGARCCVNISGSRNPDKWAGPNEDNLTDDTFDLIVETTRKIIDAVKPSQTYYSLETMPWSYPDSVDSYVKLVKAIDRKGFAVHFDPVNLVSSPQIYFNNGAMIAEAFKKLGHKIKSCHAKDILLRDDVYTPFLPEVRPGLGKLNYKVFLSELSKLADVPLMMEHLDTEEEYKMAANYIRNVEKEMDS
ncbi:MAG: sugar phosphate isomerase/epimerase family protein [Prolixibacteraceae bacterium]